MFKFIRRIFQEEGQEAKQIAEIGLNNLEEWINEKSKPLAEEIRQQTESVLMKIDEESQKTRFNLEILESAKLQNPNIPFKAKQYMEGNRKAYIRAVNSFLGHVEINNKDYFYLVDFCKKFEELINELNKGTIRSYTILQEFLANETGKIAQNLKNFDNLFRELSSILNDGRMVAVNMLRQKAQELDAKTKQKINIEVDLRNAEASLKIAGSEKDSVMADILSFSQSEEHSNFLGLVEEKKNKEKSFYADENNILQSFAVLERPLRKYSHTAFEHEETVLDYLKAPVETLASDKEFRIISVLKNLEKMLNEGQIQLDDRKKEKAIEEIKKLSREFLEEFTKRYHSFKSEIEELENKIKSTRVNEKLREFNRKLEETNSGIEKNNEEFRRLRNDSERTGNSVSNLKNEAENSIKDVFGDEVRLILNQ